GAPLGLQRLDHGDADAVLDAGDGVEEFELGKELGGNALLFRELVDTDQRCVADRLGDRSVDASAPGFAHACFGLVHGSSSLFATSISQRRSKSETCHGIVM